MTTKNDMTWWEEISTDDAIALMVAEIDKINPDAAKRFPDRVADSDFIYKGDGDPKGSFSAAFIWSATHEGVDFWRIIYEALPEEFTVTLDDLKPLTLSSWLRKVRTTAAKS